MQWWQWVLGVIEFVAAWYFTTGLIDYLKHREPRTELTEHQRWIAEQDVMMTGEDGRDYRGSTPQHIADDIREKLRRMPPPHGNHLLSAAIGLTALAAGIAGLRR